MEHHSNIIPWQMTAEERGAKIRVIPMNERGELIIDEYENLLNERTKMVAVAHVSNSLGTVNPIKEMVATAHKFGVPVCVDAAQSVPHFPVDVQDLDCDFFVFLGTQNVWADGQRRPLRQTRMARPNAAVSDRRRNDPLGHVSRKRRLPRSRKSLRPERRRSPPASVSVPPIDYINSIDFEAAAAYEHELLEYAASRLADIPGRKLIGTAANRSVSSVVYHRKCPPARHRHDPRSGRHRRPCRPSLCPTGDAVL